MTIEIPKDAREVYCNEQGKPIAYCPRGSIGITDVQRAAFYLQNKERLEQLAVRAQKKTSEEGACCGVICINVDDPTFTELVNLLMPNHDWDVYRKLGEVPVARGVVPDDLLREVARNLYPAAMDEFRFDAINIMVCDAMGISVRHPGD